MSSSVQNEQKTRAKSLKEEYFRKIKDLQKLKEEQKETKQKKYPLASELMKPNASTLYHTGDNIFMKYN
jgi:hypothetical protein